MDQRSSVAAFCSCKVGILILQKEKMTSGSIYNANKIGPKIESWGTPQETVHTVGQVNEKKNQQVHTYAVIFSLKSSQTIEKKMKEKK